MTRVSAYIPAYNAARTLALCIEALLGQTHAPHEILVIDDGSHDKTAEIARRYAQVALVQHGTNLGLEAARNTALRMARNDIVASLDAGCIADARWLECPSSQYERRKSCWRRRTPGRRCSRIPGGPLEVCAHAAGMGNRADRESFVSFWL